MGSIKYEVLTHCPGFHNGAKAPSRNTLEQYKTHTIKFAQWAKKEFKVRRFEQLNENIVEYLNQYSQHLQTMGRSPATIHTYIAGVCYAFDVHLETIQKPLRHCYAATRSRGVKAVDNRSDATREASPRLYDIAEKVGIRRREYLQLKGTNFKIDESGYPCVEVMKGKGGKYQLQRILPEDVDEVRKLFDGTTHYIFSKAEMENKIDLHHIRAEVARRAYQYYMSRLSSDPEYREQLEKEIEARWMLYRGNPPANSRKIHDWSWDVSRLRGTYRIRGKNRKNAIKNGFDVEYDRCAVMAVSVFHLSHWRCDVTIDHYLLAV